MFLRYFADAFCETVLGFKRTGTKEKRDKLIAEYASMKDGKISPSVFVCGELLIKETYKGRAIYYCPFCQHEDEY